MIRFENVAKVYDANSAPALDDVSIDIERGEFVYLVGASGSGKSTLLQLVLREHRASGGRVLVAGKDVAALSSWKVPHLRRQMGAVFQDFRLLPNKTVFENVAFALEVLGRSRSQISRTVPQTLEMVGLAGKERRRPHELSGGEQQRVAIARAFVNRPAILLADEPTGNLDPTTSRGIMNVLDRINATGTTIVMATHDVALVDEIRRRVIELENGKVIRDEVGGTYVTTTSIPVIRLDEDEEAAVAAEEAERIARHSAPGDAEGSGEAETWEPAEPVEAASDLPLAAEPTLESAPDSTLVSEPVPVSEPVVQSEPVHSEPLAQTEPADPEPAPTSRREIRERRARQAQAEPATEASLSESPSWSVDEPAHWADEPLPVEEGFAGETPTDAAEAGESLATEDAVDPAEEELPAEQADPVEVDQPELRPRRRRLFRRR